MKKLLFVCAAFAAASVMAEGKVIRIYNNQTSVPTNFVYAMASQFNSGLRFKAEVVTEKPAGDPLAGGKYGFAVIVDENSQCPAKMVCSPDDGFVRVNVAALKTDNPDAKTLGQRCLKEMWRGFCFAMGSGYTKNPMCLLKPTDGSLKALDELGSCCPSPEAFGTVMIGAAKRGIEPSND